MIKYKMTKIKDMGKVVTGKTPPTAVSDYYDGEYLFISPSELHGSYKVTDTPKKLTPNGMNAIKSNIISGTSVLVGCIGWDMGNTSICLETCATNQQINSITAIHESKYNPYFIYYWLSGKKDYLFSIASVTRTPILNKSTFQDVEIPMPPKPEQDVITRTLLLIDKKIENNNAVNDNLAA